MRAIVACVLALLSPAYGFSVAPPRPVMRSRSHTSSTNILMAEESPKPAGSGLPLRSAFLGLIFVQSLFGLSEDIPRFFTTPMNPDIFTTIVDIAFLGYSGKVLLEQAGVLREGDAATANVDLSGFTCTLVLSVGREPGTWMPDEWAKSGARLSLPLQITFTNEEVDLGFPGEEALKGRYASKLICEGGSFVGPNGVVNVKTTGGAWSAVPTTQPGTTALRGFLDFPEEAVRNDVSLPAGRVFFSSVILDSEKVRDDAKVPIQDCLDGPGGVQLLRSGGLTIKRNDIRNLYGALGDVMLILGRMSFAEQEVVRDESKPETPQERAARERAEDAARGRKF